MFEALFGLSGKTALITGGGTGIGRMMTEGLAAAGAHVFICSRKLDVVETTAAEINAMGLSGKVTAFKGDIGSEAGVDALVSELKKQTDALDILINNAGISWGAPLGSFPYSAWEKVMSVNVAGVFDLTQKLLPMLDQSGQAGAPSRIINIGSCTGTGAMGEQIYSYAASKSAVHHLTKCLMAELAAKQITVNAIAPGPFPSNMMDFALSNDQIASNIAKNVPMGRVGQPTDLQATALFLAGPGGAFVTGAVVPVDGGLHAVGAGNMMAP